MTTKKEWLRSALREQKEGSSRRKPGGRLSISPFKDWDFYYLNAPISWAPNPDHAAKFLAVEVPEGFVTDFASIPRAFWSLLPPSADYTYAAIIHDFLYWFQERPRTVADKIFKLTMRDFQVDSLKIFVIYNAVNLFGSWAWQNNVKLKACGEKRILKTFPEDPSVSWRDWKKYPNVFAS